MKVYLNLILGATMAKSHFSGPILCFFVTICFSYSFFSSLGLCETEVGSFGALCITCSDCRTFILRDKVLFAQN